MADARQAESAPATDVIKIVILISGRGSNMLSIIRAIKSGSMPGIRIGHVISNVADAPGLEAARGHGIECSVINDIKKELGARLEDLKPDIVCMAGFMRIVPPEIIQRYVTLNIHPSLLPKYPGLHAQRQAIQDGAKWSGCTVHYADEGVDTGPIIVQHAVPVMPDDTEDVLAGRILEKEHAAYPNAIRIVAGRILRKRHNDNAGAP